MKKVITYGTFDLLHQGHIRLLERAKALGDYLIVGITSDDFDLERGKINVQQSLAERYNSVQSTGIADEIIVEEHEGQKIEDIIKYGIDVFTVGSDWIGTFDYLNEYCDVVYLPRTIGISSTEIRGQSHHIRFGLIGEAAFMDKIVDESKIVDGLDACAVYSPHHSLLSEKVRSVGLITDSLDELWEAVDAVYIRSDPASHMKQVKQALENGKHILCESPLAIKEADCIALFDIAKKRKLVLMEAIKTAYATAYERMILLLKSGIIGEILSVEATCTQLRGGGSKENIEWQGIYEWGPTAMLPVFQILGTNYTDYQITTSFHKNDSAKDRFTHICFFYEHGIGQIKIGDGIKSEGELVVSGTRGYIYIPAPWWKTDYFEVRYENQTENKRYFYQLKGEGIRRELSIFARAIWRGEPEYHIESDITKKIAEVMEAFNKRQNMRIV